MPNMIELNGDPLVQQDEDPEAFNFVDFDVKR